MSIFEEQKKSSKICKNELNKLVYKSLERHKEILELVENIKEFNPQETAFKYYEMNRISQVKVGYKFLANFIKKNMFDVSKKELPVEINYFVNYEVPGGVSALMVRPLIDTLCSDEQKQKWLPLFDTGMVIGAYAQTELGHGSDVQSLETEATFDEKTQEFIINSPTTSSFKWWPGEMANLATVAIVMAKTIVQNKKIGVFPFIVQIRDFETHKPLKNVEIGDIGPKFGYCSKENGFLKFTNFRIPRENMPSKFTEITPNCEVIKKGNQKIIYSSMMKSRTLLLEFSAYYLGKGTSIALRYSFLRKQFKNEKKEEIPVIQYQLQQYRLFVLLAKSYAMKCAFNKIVETVKFCNNLIKNNNFTQLQETHVILSGAKSLYTGWCNTGLMVCMTCCGGHGYSKYTGITNIIETTAPNTILEGENSMLLLQVGMFLLKMMKYIHEGKLDKVNGYCQYLKNGDELNNFNEKFDEDLSNRVNMKKFWQKAVFMKLMVISEQVIELSANMSIRDIFNKKITIKVHECSKLHSILFTYDYFLEYIDEVLHFETKESLYRLAQLFIIDLTLQNAHLFLGLNVISSEQIKKLNQVFEKTLEDIFCDCLKLTDPFMIDDGVNYSALVNSNERPYENLYDLAKKFGVVNNTDLTGAYLNTIRKASIETYPNPRL